MMNSVPAGVAGTVGEVCARQRAAGRVRRAAVPGASRSEAGVHPQPRRDRAAHRPAPAATLGLESVVGFSEADRDGLAARQADRAVCLGPGPAGRELPARRPRRPGRARHRLRRHPSRLRLSVREPQAGRARPRARPGVRRAAHRGDQAGRRQAGRPRRGASGPGSPCCPAARSPTPQDARELAEQIGYPVLVKAAGGGGGRGIKRAGDGDELESLLGLARGEAGAAFGDERALRRAAGRVRAPRGGPARRRRAGHGGPPRRARLLGAAPLSEGGRGGARPGAGRRDPRRRLREAAVAFAGAIGYQNLGTAEFVARRRARPAVLPRGQLPHPGRASGHRGRHRPRPGRACSCRSPPAGRWASPRTDVTLTGHAIECRLNAEDVTRRLHAHPGHAVAVLHP